MEKSKAFAIFGLIILGGLYALFKDPIQFDEPPPPAPTPSATQAARAKVAAAQGGLQITDSKIGAGNAAAAGDRVTLNYRGTLLNGTVFDQTQGRGPFSFTLGRGEVIKGWDAGIDGMKVGGKRKLVIPPQYGYGSGSPGKIPPNSTLIFEVELLKIEKG